MDYLETTKKQEAEVNIVLEKINQLIVKKEPLAKIKLEYRNYVEQVAALYTLFFDQLKDKKNRAELTAEQWEKQNNFLVQRYKKEIIQAAIAIDDQLGLD